MIIRQMLIALLITMLAVSPAMAAHCSVSCGSAQTVSTAIDMSGMEDMADCHHATPEPDDKSSNTHNKCNMAGCHAVSAAAFVQPDTYSYTFDPDRLHSHFIPTAVSADLPPPIKPPA